jgi:hypothetical protein
MVSILEMETISLRVTIFKNVTLFRQNVKVKFDYFLILMRLEFFEKSY